MKKMIITKKIALSFIAAVIAVTSIPVSSYAADLNFFRSNDILHYDGSTCSVENQEGEKAVVGGDNAEKIFLFLTSKTFSGLGGKSFNAIQAAGALGNFEQESGMDPGAQEPAPGTGHGLAQWSNTRDSTRLSQLLNFASSEGMMWSDLDLQLKMIEKEINDYYGAQLLAAGFGEVTSPVDASFIFQKIYEGAGVPMQEKRDSAAAAYYEKFKNLAPATAGSESETCGSPGQGLTEFMGDDFTLYNQCDEPWGPVKNAGGYTSCAAACGPVSLAMVVKNLGGQNITPTDTNSYYDQEKLWASINGYGNGSWIDGLETAGAHYNLRTEQFNTKDINAYKDVFANGGLIILSGRGTAPFFEQGHFIVLRGITDDGKFKIGDPGRRENNSIDWDIQQIIDKADVQGGVAFYV